MKTVLAWIGGIWLIAVTSGLLIAVAERGYYLIILGLVVGVAFVALAIAALTPHSKTPAPKG